MKSKLRKKTDQAIKWVKRKFTNKKNAQTKNYLKNCFRTFFEGNELAGIDPVKHYPITNLGITKFDFNIKCKEIILTIHSWRPGLIIGKGGSTIDGLTEHMNKYHPEKKVSLRLVEDKLWHNYTY